MDSIRTENLNYKCHDLVKSVELISKMRVLMIDLDTEDPKSLRLMSELCLSTGKVDVVVLILGQAEKISLSVAVVNDKVNDIKAMDLFRSFAEDVGAKGGGKKDFAQGSLPISDGMTVSKVKEICLEKLTEVTN